MKKKGIAFWLVLLVILLAGCMLAALSVGSANIPPLAALRVLLAQLPGVEEKLPGSTLGGGLFEISLEDVSAMQQYIVLQVRFPRILLSVLVGAGLSAAGCIFQGLFRNPLAEPHILGVSSGAALGATIAMLTGIQVSLLGLGTIGICAFLGAMLTIGIVYLAAGLGKRASTVGILLTGTAVSTLFSSMISLLMSLNQDQIEKVYLWTMGSFSAASWVKVGYAALFGAAGLGVCLLYSQDLNLMAMGEETAESLGVECRRVRTLLILLASLVVAVCVSVSGVIGFVGLVVPHCMRFLVGGDYRRVLPASLLGGGLFLLLCDTLARTLTAPGELPVGVITSILGAPYLIYLIKKNTEKRR